MSAEDKFPELICRVRAGDSQAAAELVQLYEPEIRRAVRVRLRDVRLRRVFDSMDVCQSVLVNFFARAALGQFDIERPEQVLKLLVTMAHNRLNDQVRKHHARRRDNRRQEAGDALLGLADSASSPSHIAAGKELMERMRSELSDEERYLADQRALGRDWADIAAEHGGSPDSLRMKLQRAMDRVIRQLGL